MTYHRALMGVVQPPRRSDLVLGHQLITLGDSKSYHFTKYKPSGVSRLLLDGEFRGTALVWRGAGRSLPPLRPAFATANGKAAVVTLPPQLFK